MRLFNLFKKKKKAIIPIENEISKALNIKGINVVDLEQQNRRIREAIIRRGVVWINGNKRTQSVSDKIGARKRSNATLVKNKRVMRRKLIEVIQLDSRPSIELVCNLINIHTDATFDEYKGEFNKLF